MLESITRPRAVRTRVGATAERGLSHGSCAVPAPCPDSARGCARTFSLLPPLTQSRLTFRVDPHLLLDLRREPLKSFVCFPGAPLSLLSLKGRKCFWHACWPTSSHICGQAHALPRAPAAPQHQPRRFLLPSPSLTDAASRNTVKTCGDRNQACSLTGRVPTTLSSSWSSFAWGEFCA